MGVSIEFTPQLIQEIDIRVIQLSLKLDIRVGVLWLESIFVLHWHIESVYIVVFLLLLLLLLLLPCDSLIRSSFYICKEDILRELDIIRQRAFLLSWQSIVIDRVESGHLNTLSLHQ